MNRLYIFILGMCFIHVGYTTSPHYTQVDTSSAFNVAVSVLPENEMDDKHISTGSDAEVSTSDDNGEDESTKTESMPDENEAAGQSTENDVNSDDEVTE